LLKFKQAEQFSMSSILRGIAKPWHDLKKHNAFGANAGLTAATNLALGIIGVFTGAIAARLLSPHGRGELAAIQTYPTLIGYLALLGTGQSVVYYSARDRARASRYLGCAIVISMASCLPLIGIVYLALPALLSAQSYSTVQAARWYLAVVPLVALMSLWLFALRGLSEFVAWNVLRIAPVLAWLALLLFCWRLGINNPGSVAAGYLAILAALLIPIILVSKKYLNGSLVPVSGDLKPMLIYGLPCVASTFPTVVNLRLDQMLMAAILSPVALGLYVAAVAWSGAINPLLNAVSSVLFPRIAGHDAQMDRMRSFSAGSRFAVLLALLITPVLAAATPWGIVLLFGRKFGAAVPAALILVPAGAVAAVNTVIEEGFRGLGMPTAPLYAQLSGMATTMVSLYFLLRPLGIVGASIASLLGYSTVTIALLFQARLLTGHSPAALLLPTAGELRAGIRQFMLLARRMAPAISRA
jgi:O-antigen/teichoic acid export membrane protein